MVRLVRKFNNLKYYQGDLIKQHLEEMSNKGYKFNKIAKIGWIYEEITPTNIKYDVTYSTEVIENEDWALVSSYYDMHIFTTEKSIPSPIAKDENSEFKLINKLMKKNTMPILVIFLMIIISQIFYQINYILKNPLEAFGFNSPVFVMIYLILMIAFFIPINSYISWYDKSKKNLKLDLGLAKNDKNKNKILSNITISFILIGFILLPITVINLANSFVQSQTIIKTIYYENGLSREVELYQDEIPFKFEDLGFDDSEYYSYFKSFDIDNLFLKYIQCHQSKLHIAQEDELNDLVHFDYSIIEVKFTPAFNMILNSIIKNNYQLIEYLNVDKFYEKSYTGDSTSKYVFTKDSKIVIIQYYAYEPSQNQIDISVEKLLEFEF